MLLYSVKVSSFRTLHYRLYSSGFSQSLNRFFLTFLQAVYSWMRDCALGKRKRGRGNLLWSQEEEEDPHPIGLPPPISGQLRRGGEGGHLEGRRGREKSVDEKREKGGREGEQQLELKSFCLKGSSSSFLPRFSPPPLPIFFLSLFLPLSEISQAFLFFSSFSNSP